MSATAARKNPNRGANAKRTNNQGSKWISKAARLAIYLRDGFACCYCGKDLREAQCNKAGNCDITLDHLDPRSSELCPTARRNPKRLVTACRKCNSTRQDQPWRQYATGGAIARIERQVRKPLNLTLARALLKGEARNDELEAR